MKVKDGAVKDKNSGKHADTRGTGALVLQGWRDHDGLVTRLVESS